MKQIVSVASSLALASAFLFMFAGQAAVQGAAGVNNGAGNYSCNDHGAPSMMLKIVWEKRSQLTVRPVVLLRYRTSSP